MKPVAELCAIRRRNISANKCQKWDEIVTENCSLSLTLQHYFNICVKFVHWKEIRQFSWITNGISNRLTLLGGKQTRRFGGVIHGIIIPRFLQRKGRFPKFDTIADSAATTNEKTNQRRMTKQGRYLGL
jgi:hypothetical protein